MQIVIEKVEEGYLLTVVEQTLNAQMQPMVNKRFIVKTTKEQVEEFIKTNLK